MCLNLERFSEEWSNVYAVPLKLSYVSHFQKYDIERLKERRLTATRSWGIVCPLEM